MGGKSGLFPGGPLTAFAAAVYFLPDWVVKVMRL